VSGNHRLETRFTLETFEADVRTSCLSVSAQEESFDARLKAGSFGLKPKIVLYYGARLRLKSAVLAACAKQGGQIEFVALES
jgi:hypothetical protein